MVDHITGEEYEQMELEEDDLELLEENTGTSVRNRLSRLRRGRESDSPPAASSSKRRAIVESSDEDLDRDDARPRATGVQDLWDDDKRDDEDDGGMDTDSFIEYSDEEGGQEGREERRRVQKQDAERRRRARGARPELAGIDIKCVISCCAANFGLTVYPVLGTSFTTCLGMAKTITGHWNSTTK